ncbi:DUF502 domain-containing protein [Mariniphaga sediminis]|jgi:uncharacterized membrane protein|uniref:DUF502 domain-containing protein n=1 Tax=Mariniphaga sediminis TaxID=1628158 RepID=A0A399D528_9BACT|nr:DUF502 domain-containing protein [Mariniphaga sediminis]RIH66298.1 DUF502 domain-containing protein [Mariniphaga sediminis]
MHKKIVQYFLQGILLIAPVVIVVYILYSLFVTVDGWLNGKLEPLLGFTLPGLGILILFISLTLLGFLGQTAFISPLKRIAGNLVKRIPLLNLLYSSINDLFSAFVGKEKKFNTPVKVLFNQENNLWKLGFVTKETLDEIGNGELAAVYFPHSYNFSGELYLVPKERVHLVNMSPAEMMKFIVSGGVTRFENIEILENDTFEEK